MTIAASADLIREIQRLHLLEGEHCAEAARLPASDARELARDLVRRGWLTPHQVNKLFQGKGDELLLGSYVLLEKFGEGGMGAVFKGRNWKLGRVVALKLIRKDRLANEAAVQRFQREIRAAAQLDHPNIVRALDADHAGEVHFLVMEFVAGTDLAKLLKEKGPLPIAEACDYARQVALGLQHAYERGLVHRDIKPHNLLLASGACERPGESHRGVHTPRSPGVVKILDFGLARVEHHATDESSSGLTDDRIVMGTLDYVAPEQTIDAHGADIRADLYGLGCTLYHLLTGKVPFPGGSPGEKIGRHLHAPPPPVEQLRPEVPPRVAAVIRKLMAKDRERRYQTPAEAAQALAAALLPEAAQTTEQTEVVSSAHWSDLTPGAASDPRPDRRSWLKTAAALTVLPAAGLTYWLTRPPQQGSDDEPSRSASPLDALAPDQIPAEECFDGQPKELVAVLGERRQRHWHIVYALACSADSKLVASGGDDFCIRVWDAATMNEREVLKEDGYVRSLAFSAQGDLLACNVSAGAGRIWDLTTKRLTPLLGDVEAAVNVVAFSPQGSLFAAGCADGNIRLWDLAGKQPGKPSAVVKTAGPSVSALAFAPDGHTVASASDGFLELWDLDAQRGSLNRRFGKKIGAWVISLTFAPNNKVLASIGDGCFLWDLQPAEPVSRPIPAPEHCTGSNMAFSPDGGTLARGIWSGVKLWRVKGTEATLVFPWSGGSPYFNYPVAFAPDGKTFYSSGHDGYVRARDWSPTGLTERGSGSGPTGSLHAVAFTPDDRSLAAYVAYGYPLKWDLTGPRSAPPELLEWPAEAVGDVTFMSHGHILAVCRGGARSLWDLSGNVLRVVTDLSEHPKYGARALAVAPTNTEIAVAFTGDNLVRRWRLLPDGKVTSLPPLKDHPGSLTLAYSPDGTRLASGGGGIVRVEKLDGAGRDRLLDFPGHQGEVQALAYAPDGRLLATGDARAVQLWDPDKRDRLPVVLTRHKGQVRSLAFGRDGTLLASVDQAGAVIVSEVATRNVVSQWKLGGPVHGVAFAADGRHVATANGNGTVYILRLPV